MRPRRSTRRPAWWWGTRRAAARARQLSRVRAAPPPYLAAILFALAVAVAIGAELGIPTRFLGSGEKPDDLRAFDKNRFVEEMV